MFPAKKNAFPPMRLHLGAFATENHFRLYSLLFAFFIIGAVRLRIPFFCTFPMANHLEPLPKGCRRNEVSSVFLERCLSFFLERNESCLPIIVAQTPAFWLCSHPHIYIGTSSEGLDTLSATLVYHASRWQPLRVACEWGRGVNCKWKGGSGHRKGPSASRADALLRGLLCTLYYDTLLAPPRFRRAKLLTTLYNQPVAYLGGGGPNRRTSGHEKGQTVTKAKLGKGCAMVWSS